MAAMAADAHVFTSLIRSNLLFFLFSLKSSQWSCSPKQCYSLNTFKEVKSRKSVEGEKWEHKYWECKIRLLLNSFLAHIRPSDLGEYKNFENYAFSKFLYFKMVKLKIGMSQSGRFDSWILPEPVCVEFACLPVFAWVIPASSHKSKTCRHLGDRELTIPNLSGLWMWVRMVISLSILLCYRLATCPGCTRLSSEAAGIGSRLQPMAPIGIQW